jgi:hypothetical protein
MQQDPIKYRGPFKYDDAGTYYYEFDWSGSKIYGDRELQISFRVKQDKNYLTHWDSSNDYSKKGLTKEYVVYKNVPVYLNGVKVYGEEPPKMGPTPTPTFDPGATPTSASVKVSYKCGIEDETKNTLRNTINIKNTGTSPVSLSDIKVRYWFTNDGSEQDTFACEYAVCGTSNVIGKVVKIDNPVDNADSYCEITFSNEAGKLAPGGSTGDIPFRIESKSDYDKTNDYSYDSKMSSLGDNDKITAYVNGTLKYGVEPVKIINTDIVLGDVNDSGTVDAIDFAILKKYLLGMIDLDSDAYTRADVNKDTSVNAIDFALIRMYLLGIKKSF